MEVTTNPFPDERAPISEWLTVKARPAAWPGKQLAAGAGGWQTAHLRPPRRCCLTRTFTELF